MNITDTDHGTAVCDWCGLPLHGAVYCHRSSCTLPNSEHGDVWLYRIGLGLCAFTALGIIAQIVRGWP